ncbi:MAG: DNA polymerase III subunit delta', partial [Bacteroidetes bacterium]|nr:DNA polymerase III subunit delta' [Bacteroidota bacterium]
MALESIIGQERVSKSLKRTLSSGRIAHAYLFHGPEGSGKAAAALAFARALQCEHPVDGDTCGRCASCSKAARGMHPDIHVLMPVTKDTDEEERGRRIQLLYEDPYQPADMQSLPSLDGSSGASNKQIIYSRGQVQKWLQRPMSFHRVEGQYR